MARVDAEHRLIACILPLENTGAPFAFLTLAFLRYGREEFGGIEFIKLVDHDAIRDRLGQRLEDGGVDGSDYGSTFVAFERNVIALRFRHDATDAVDSSRSVGNDREM